MKMFRAVAVFLSLAFLSCASANSILEGWKSALVLNYDNGDSLSISCTDRESHCIVHVTVAAHKFAFGREELKGLEITADRADLYSVQNGDRYSNFAFNVSVICPEETTSSVPHWDCAANVSVVDGKVEIELERWERTPVKQLAPNNSFKPNMLRSGKRRHRKACHLLPPLRMSA